MKWNFSSIRLLTAPWKFYLKTICFRHFESINMFPEKLEFQFLHLEIYIHIFFKYCIKGNFMDSAAYNLSKNILEEEKESFKSIGYKSDEIVIDEVLNQGHLIQKK